MLFIDKIQLEISERESVLNEVEKILYTKRYRLSSKHFEIFSVHSVSIIYSIWEGFIQKSFSLFIDELNSVLIDKDDVKTEILITDIESKFQYFKNYPTKVKQKFRFYEKLKIYFETEKLSLQNLINSESNVSLEVLNRLMKSYHLEEFPEYWSQYCHPNSSLKNSLKDFLRYRNSVSHGGDISSEEKVTQAVFNKYKLLVVELMYEIALRMDDSIKNRKYMKNNV